MSSSVWVCVAIIILGGIISLGAAIVLLINAFRQHVGWFFLVLCVPFGAMIFASVHWAEAKASYMFRWIGTILIVVGLLGIPGTREQTLKQVKASLGMTEVKGPDLTAQIQEHRNQIETLQAAFARNGTALTQQYQQLDAQRKALKPGDTEAIQKFNEAAADYQARNGLRKQMQEKIASLQTELDGLLETRSRTAAAKVASQKKVVMYATASCPACQVARQYFAQKGVVYEEIDVESSRSSYEAFQKLGGHAVPLIFVGDTRMEGFNAARLDLLL